MDENSFPRPLKLMTDYGCSPVWENDKEGHRVGLVEVDTLPISDKLRSALRAWATAFYTTLDDVYPPDSGFDSIEKVIAFQKMREVLVLRLKQELGTG